MITPGDTNRLEQFDGRDDVSAPVLFGVQHGFADQRLRSEVKYAVENR